MHGAEIEVQGEVHPAFAAVADLLRSEVADSGRGGAAVAVYHRGELVVDAWAGAKDAAGAPWEADTLAMSQSTTKGVTSTTVHLCAERGLLRYDDPIARHWPEFGVEGKDGITIAHALTHEAGLFPLRPLVDHALEMNDWEHMTTRLAAATPVHAAGAANGYHAFTFGWLVGEVVRRVTGGSIGRFVRDEIAGPLGCDGLWIGLPEDDAPRLAELLPDPSPGAGPLARALGARAAAEEPTGTSWSLANVQAAFGADGLDQWLRSPETPHAEVPAVNGCFTARSLARLYALWADGGHLGATSLLSEDRVRTAATARNDRNDVVLFVAPHWRLGFHAPFLEDGVLATGLGHNGFGGSGAWADPSRRLAVAFTVNALSSGSAVGDGRVARIGSTALRCADDRR